MACNVGGAGEDIPEGPGLVSPTAAEHLTMQHGQVNSQNHSGACVNVQLDPLPLINVWDPISWMYKGTVPTKAPQRAHRCFAGATNAPQVLHRCGAYGGPRVGGGGSNPGPHCDAATPGHGQAWWGPGCFAPRAKHHAVKPKVKPRGGAPSGNRAKVGVPGEFGFFFGILCCNAARSLVAKHPPRVRLIK